MNRHKRRRKLTQTELRAIETTPGLIVRRISPEGHSSLEELTPEVRSAKPPLFARGLTSNTENSEARESA
jgi:hypothetical protein